MRKLFFSILVLLTILLITTPSKHGHGYRERSRFNRHRIFGGEPVIQHEFNFLVSIRQYGRFKCGASLIAPDIVLTAAHCLEEGTTDTFRAAAGDHSLVRNEGAEQEEKFRRFVLHEDYDTNKFGNDLALIQLQRPIRLNNKRGTVFLPQTGFKATQATIMGWGKVYPDGKAWETPNKLKVTLVDRKTCTKQTYFYLAKGDMCYVGGKGKGFCSGDSGSPLMCGAVQCGIATFFRLCGEGYPDAYTNVTYYADWIRDTMAKLRSS